MVLVDSEGDPVMTQYLKAAVEILTNPHGPSIGMVEGAIAALQAHVEVTRRRAGEVDLEDRLAEARAIEVAEGWVTDAIDCADDYLAEPPIKDEDGSIAYAQMLERQAEQAAMRHDWAYREYF